MTKFLLIRHGETDWSLNEKQQLKGGFRDLPSLTETGIQQATNLTLNPRLQRAEIILSSPYTRTMQTAAIISRQLDLDIKVEFDLREWQPNLGFGVNNLLELNVAIANYNKHGGIHPANTPQNWEEKAALKYRAEQVLKKFLHYNLVAVITHEQLIKTLINLNEIDYCSINEIELI